MWLADRIGKLRNGADKVRTATSSATARTRKGRFIMKNFGFASAIATGFAAALFGLAAPASADVDHHQWIHDIQQQATVGSAQSTIGNGR